MKLQKHSSRIARDGEVYFKWEVILPKEEVEKAGFKENDELIARGKKDKIELKRKTKTLQKF